MLFSHQVKQTELELCMTILTAELPMLLLFLDRLNTFPETPPLLDFRNHPMTAPIPSAASRGTIPPSGVNILLFDKNNKKKKINKKIIILSKTADILLSYTHSDFQALVFETLKKVYLLLCAVSIHLPA